MKKGFMFATVRIEYVYDEEKTNEQDARTNAINLAIKPNFHSVVEGTNLSKVEVDYNDKIIFE